MLNTRALFLAPKLFRRARGLNTSSPYTKVPVSPPIGKKKNLAKSLSEESSKLQKCELRLFFPTQAR